MANGDGDNGDSGGGETTRTQLASLQRIRQVQPVQMADLDAAQTRILDTTRRLEQQDALVSEMSAERQRLLDERNSLLDQLRIVQQDYDLLGTHQAAVRQARDATRKDLEHLQSVYEPLKDAIDAERSAHGLQRLPTLQETIESRMNTYLEERRGRWLQNGLLDEPGGALSGDHAHAAGTDHPSPGQASTPRSATAGSPRTPGHAAHSGPQGAGPAKTGPVSKRQSSSASDRRSSGKQTADLAASASGTNSAPGGGGVAKKRRS
ncbi:hypothetical protein BC831DRAFT_513830 [Entophlyctis helioformis]|nr:hypothetical protein BC831DRAFT_513830 [Entophlyctis helioformis]